MCASLRFSLASFRLHSVVHMFLSQGSRSRETTRRDTWWCREKRGEQVSHDSSCCCFALQEQKWTRLEQDKHIQYTEPTDLLRVCCKAMLLVRALRLPSSVRVSTCAAVLDKVARDFTKSSSSTSPRVETSLSTCMRGKTWIDVCVCMHV